MPCWWEEREREIKKERMSILGKNQHFVLDSFQNSTSEPGEWVILQVQFSIEKNSTQGKQNKTKTK